MAFFRTIINFPPKVIPHFSLFIHSSTLPRSLLCKFSGNLAITSLPIIGCTLPYPCSIIGNTVPCSHLRIVSHPHSSTNVSILSFKKKFDLTFEAGNPFSRLNCSVNSKRLLLDLLPHTVSPNKQPSAADSYKFRSIFLASVVSIRTKLQKMRSNLISLGIFSYPLTTPNSRFCFFIHSSKESLL